MGTMREKVCERMVKRPSWMTWLMTRNRESKRERERVRETGIAGSRMMLMVLEDDYVDDDDDVYSQIFL